MLLSRPMAGHRMFHFVRGVLVHLASAPGGKRKRQPAGLPNTHRRSGVGLEENPLNHHRGWVEPLEKPIELLHHAGQPEMNRVGVRRAQHAVFHRCVAVCHPGTDHAEPAARKTGVDAKHEHTFEL